MDQYNNLLTFRNDDRLRKPIKIVCPTALAENPECRKTREQYGGSTMNFCTHLNRINVCWILLRLASRIVKTTTTTTPRTSSSGGGPAVVPQQIQVRYTPSPPPSQPQYQIQPHTQQNVGGSQTITSSTQTTKTTRTTSSGGHQQISPQSSSNQLLQNQQHQQYYSDVANNQEVQQWLGNLNSPLIAGRQEISGQDGKCLRLRFDVSQYSPDEISVKTINGKLKVHANHEEKTNTRSSYHEFNKEFSLPIGTNPDSIKSTLSKDGVLTVEAPLPSYQNQLAEPQQYLPISNF